MFPVSSHHPPPKDASLRRIIIHFAHLHSINDRLPQCGLFTGTKLNTAGKKNSICVIAESEIQIAIGSEWRTAPPKSFAFCHSIVRSSRYFTTICFSAFWPHHLSILSIIGDGRAVLMPESHANGTYVVRPISRGCQQSICAHSSPALSLCVLLICFCIIFSWNAFLRLLLLTPLLVHIQLNYRLTTHENAKHQIDGRIVFGKTNGMFHSIYSIFCLVLVVLLEWAIIFDW